MINQKEEPLVSAIITTYNRSVDILKRAIQSVINQTYRNIEIILINACPENIELRKQIEELLTTIKDINYICLNKNSLANIARNAGFKKSNGKYIAFLDDDDEWVDNKIELQVEKFLDNSSKNIGLVYGPYYELRNDNSVKIINNRQIEGYILNEILKGNILGGTSVPMLLREALESVNGFDELFPSAQDYDVWIGICEHYEVGYINSPLVNYYVTGDAITRNLSRRISGWEMIEKKYENLYLAHKNSYNCFLNMVARQLIINGEVRKGTEYLKRAIKIKKISLENLKTIIYFFLKN